jgi:hypothetical protein
MINILSMPRVTSTIFIIFISGHRIQGGEIENVLFFISSIMNIDRHLKLEGLII